MTMPRTPDFLHRHANVFRRVRNLETGVHPTNGELSYYDTYAPTGFAIRAASHWRANPTNAPRWQRRTGLVLLSGGVYSDTGATILDDEWIATLPAPARPVQVQTIEVAADDSPYRCRVRVFPDGKMHLLADNLPPQHRAARVARRGDVGSQLMFPRRPDLLEQHADVTERVRKLEVMQVSRTLLPKPWRPNNPLIATIAGHAIRGCGLFHTSSSSVLEPRMTPEVDYIAGQVWAGKYGRLNTDLLWRFWMMLGVGPAYWVSNLQRTPGSDVRVPAYSFHTGIDAQFDRRWVVYGPALNIEELHFNGAYVFTGEGTGVPGPAAGTLQPSVGYNLIDGTAQAVPDGGWYVGTTIEKDLRFYATPGMDEPAPCDEASQLTPYSIDGSVEYDAVIPVSFYGCTNNPLHPSYSGGHMEGHYYTTPIQQISPHPRWLGYPGDLMTREQNDLFPAGPSMGYRSIDYATLRARVEMCRTHEVWAPMFAPLFGWYEGMIEKAQQIVRAEERQGWQTLPLYPGWWGRVEVKYTNRLVTFRGQAKCASMNPLTPICAYPNHLPIGDRGGGTILRVGVNGGQPLLLKLDHSFRSENLDDYLRGEGSYLSLYRPYNWVGIEPQDIQEGGPEGLVVTFDGVQFGIREGPFDHLRI